MSPHDIKRVHAGVPAGGEFASHERPEADLGLLDVSACAHRDTARDRDADINLALAGTGLSRDDIQDTQPYVGGTLIRLKSPHRAGGYDAISVTGTLGERRMIRYTRAGALHNAAGFAMVDEDGSSHELSCRAWIDGFHQPEPDEDGWPNFSREGTVNTWTSSGSRRVVHDTDPATGHMTWYNDAGIHRDGAPALFEAGKEPRWFQYGTEIPNPAPKPKVWTGGALVGGDFIPGEAITDTQARLGDHLARAARVKLIGPVKISRRGTTVTVSADPADHQFVTQLLDSYNSITFSDPENPERAIDLGVASQ